MNLRSELMQKLAALRAAGDAVSAAIAALDAVNPPVLNSPASTATEAPAAGLFTEGADGQS